jgi:hypothetical protein
VFEDRIRKRWQLWWGPPRWRHPAELVDRVHRWKEIHTLRDSRDADATWRCCSMWQRSLNNKWNSREFAKRFGCRVPDLYWSGRRVSRIPLAELPESFVIRPTFKSSRKGVYLITDGVDLMTGTPWTRAQLRAELLRTLGRTSNPPLLVEEFVRSEDGGYRLPLEFRCHVFGETVGAVEVVIRGRRGVPSRYGFFTPEWQPLDRGYTDPMPIEWIEPPKCLDEMLGWAQRLGRAYGTYVRVDCYSSDKGCVFGEFSSTPARGETFSPFTNEYFERLWSKHLGDLT